MTGTRSEALGRRLIMLSNVRQPVLILLVCGAALMVPAAFGAELQASMNLFGIYIVLSVSLNVLIGHIGILSFGHAAYFAVGGYAVGILCAQREWPLLAVLPTAMVLSVALSTVVAFASLRIKGMYFAIATLAVAELIRLAIINLDDLTNGPLGLIIPPRSLELLPGQSLGGQDGVTLGIWLTVGVCLILTFFLMRGSTGSTFRAVRENELLASSVGIHPLRVKLIGSAVAAGMGSLAGVWYAAAFAVVTPALAGVHYSALALLIVLVGGRGTLWGPVFGAGIFVFLPEVFGLEGARSEIIFGVMLVVIILLLPEGLLPSATKLIARWAQRGDPGDGPGPEVDSHLNAGSEEVLAAGAVRGEGRE